MGLSQSYETDMNIKFYLLALQYLISFSVSPPCSKAVVGWFHDVNGESSGSHRQKPGGVSGQYYPFL